jgi:hypothetical protein
MITLFDDIKMQLPVLIIFIIIFTLIINNMPVNFTFNFNWVENEKIKKFLDSIANLLTLKNISLLVFVIAIIIFDLSFEIKKSEHNTFTGDGQAISKTNKNFVALLSFAGLIGIIWAINLVIWYFFKNDQLKNNEKNNKKWYYNLSIKGKWETFANIVILVSGMIFVGLILWYWIKKVKDQKYLGDSSFLLMATGIFGWIMCLYLGWDGIKDFCSSFLWPHIKNSVPNKFFSKQTAFAIVYLIMYIVLTWVQPRKSHWNPAGLFYKYSPFVKILIFLITMRYKEYYIGFSIFYWVYYVIHASLSKKYNNNNLHSGRVKPAAESKIEDVSTQQSELPLYSSGAERHSDDPTNAGQSLDR